MKKRITFVLAIVAIMGNTVCAAEKEVVVPEVYVGKSISIVEEPIVEFSGAVTGENSCQEYTYKAPRSGRYCLEQKNIPANNYMDSFVNDSSGTQLAHNFCDSEQILDLYEGETYIIQASQYLDYDTEYNLTLHVQKETVNLVDVTEIHDQITFYGQTNKYIYTAPRNGCYRFNLDDTPLNSRFNLLVFDSNGINRVSETWGIDGKQLYLKAGEKYEIQVKQPAEETICGSYTLHIYEQKETQDISEASVVSDSIEFLEQRNYYEYTASEEGTYTFKLSDIEAGNVFNCSIRNEDGESVSENDGAAQEVYLEAGRTYRVSVEQKEGTGTYVMNITSPKDIYGFITGEIMEDTEFSAEDGELMILQKKNSELESEVERLQEENDVLIRIIEDNGLTIPDMENE